MFVKAYTGALAGIDAVPVAVEVNITGGGLGLYLVGLPDSAVKEIGRASCRERVLRLV